MEQLTLKLFDEIVMRTEHHCRQQERQLWDDVA